MSEQIDTSVLATAVEDWLRGEHEYQFGKFDRIYGAELQARRTFIATQEIPNKWHRNVVLRAAGATRLATQQVLKVCAAQRAVTVYDACLAGDERDQASKRSFAQIHDYLQQPHLVDESILYNSNYHAVYGTHEPAFLLRKASQLALLAVITDVWEQGRLNLPPPGLPSGQLT